LFNAVNQIRHWPEAAVQKKAEMKRKAKLKRIEFHYGESMRHPGKLPPEERLQRQSDKPGVEAGQQIIPDDLSAQGQVLNP